MANNNNTPSIPKSASQELGKSGTVIFSGYITQEEYNANLVGIKANHKYEIMRRSDSTIRSALQIVKLPIQSTTWDVEAARGDDGTVSDEDQMKADFIKRELMGRKVNFVKFIKAALTSFDFGFSVFEKVYEITDFNGKPMIGLAKLGSRKQVTIYRWETQDKQPGITQLISDGTVVSIPREKLIVFTHDQEGDNYQGISLLRYVYKEWDIKDKLTLINAVALEKMGVGVPVIEARDGQDPTADDEDDAIDALTNMRANEKSYLKIPKTLQVSMLDMKSATTKDILPTIEYLDGRIMTAILARFMELGGKSGSGAKALSQDLSSIFMKSEEAVAKDIVAAITDDLITQLCDLNFTDMSGGYPKLTFGSIADDDNLSLAGAVAELVGAGAMTPNLDLENNLRDRFRLPEISEEDREANKLVPGTSTLTNEAKDVTTTTPGEKPVAQSEIDKLESEEDVKASLEKARNLRDNFVGFIGSQPGS